MSKTLIVLMVGLLAVGCETLTPEEKALRDSVVGVYERAYALKSDGTVTSGNVYQHRCVFLKNGIVEAYKNGKQVDEVKWSIVDGDIHTTNDHPRSTRTVDGAGNSPISIGVFRINKDSSITIIAIIHEGKREALTLANGQFTIKKIK